uniref:cation transporter n=2 Tax=Methanobacteriaceae TaxID=2159 RepID=UPI00384BB195
GETINEKVILFHLLGDVFGWVAILIISVILMFWNVSFLDPLLSLIISLWLLYNMGKALHESVCVLLQKSPKNIDVSEVKSQIESLNHVDNISDMHLWSLDGIDSILTLKISIDDVNNGDEVKNEIQTIASKYHIIDTTVEFM